MRFEQEWEQFVEGQRREAKGMRREMLERDLTGSRKMCEILREVFGTLDSLTLENEFMSTTGIKIYADVFHSQSGSVFEADGYVVHAEKITRERFAFERMRMRSFVMLGCRYMPFTWDELDKKPDVCKRAVFELLGRCGNSGRGEWLALEVHERELVRCAMVHPGTFSLPDACGWLRWGPQPTRKVLRRLMDKDLVRPEGGSARRHFKFNLTEQAGQLQ
jgi:hypothetical protein